MIGKCPFCLGTVDPNTGNCMDCGATEQEIQEAKDEGGEVD